MAEYIERQAAIREFETNGSGFVYGRRTCAAIISRLKLVPAADVRPVVRGKWKLGGYGQISDATEKWYDKYLVGGFLYCSVCKGRSSGKTNFCPHCGADMRGGEQDGRL